ncbi:hypothetical protein ACS8Y6_18285 [Salinisphaera sp. RV14]|uniref:hypothetical protein n=1 Tax=unclassified Salinisphaera TaxID=2649847 RepID=UPI003F863AF8
MSKNAAVVRKHLGNGHIPAQWAETVNHFAQHVLSSYLNTHRYCPFAREHVDAQGKIRKTDPDAEVATPDDKFKLLPNASTRIKAGLDFDTLDAQVYAMSYDAAARQLNAERDKLFKSISKPHTPRSD